MEYSVKEYSVHSDDEGALVAIETEKEIPFEIRRVYYVYNTLRHSIRGRHSHKVLEQVIFCPVGSCDFTLDDGKSRVTIPLDKPNKGLYIKGNIWREFTNFSEGCVVIVLASTHYSEADYIRNYDEFLASVKADK